MSLLDQLNLAAPAASGLSDAAFEATRRFIYEQTGILFRDNKRYLLESRVGRRVAVLGLPDYDAYLRALRNGRAREELPELINAVTINETYFFRHAEQHTTFVEEVLPELVEERLRAGQRRVRLWSAACSTGDEPYTLALLIRERLAARYPRVAFEIVGTDINTEVLARAKEGVYSPYAVRNVPPDLLARYFTRRALPRGEAFELDDAVRAAVTFRPLNLVDAAAVRQMRDVDAAFCANVLIYFDDAAKQAAAAHLYAALRPGGYLFVGVSETLYGVTQAFRPVRLAQAVAYRKEPSPPAPPPRHG
jgi:chemotaxis protein methyltransferase CheR